MVCSDVSPSFSTSTFVEHMYEQIAQSINEYEVVISRWPQYLLALENVSHNLLECLSVAVSFS